MLIACQPSSPTLGEGPAIAQAMPSRPSTGCAQFLLIRLRPSQGRRSCSSYIVGCELGPVPCSDQAAAPRLSLHGAAVCKPRWPPLLGLPCVRHRPSVEPAPAPSTRRHFAAQQHSGGPPSSSPRRCVPMSLAVDWSCRAVPSSAHASLDTTLGPCRRPRPAMASLPIRPVPSVFANAAFALTSTICLLVRSSFRRSRRLAVRLPCYPSFPPLVLVIDSSPSSCSSRSRSGCELFLRTGLRIAVVVLRPCNNRCCQLPAGGYVLVVPGGVDEGGVVDRKEAKPVQYSLGARQAPEPEFHRRSCEYRVDLVVVRYIILRSEGCGIGTTAWRCGGFIPKAMD